MEKLNFENSPSTQTPVNATNLNLVQTNVENEFTNYVKKPTELFSSSSGSYSSTINLTKDGNPISISNYEYVEILFTDGDGANNSVKVYTKNQTSVKVLLTDMSHSNGNYLWMKIGMYTLSGSTFSQIGTKVMRFSSTPSIDYLDQSDGSIGIKKVLGYE